MEKIKDFFYDISDLLISVLIIAGIFAVISWKLNETIPIDSTSLPEKPVAEKPADTPTDAPNKETPEKPISDASDADKPIGENSAQTPTDTTLKPPSSGGSTTNPPADVQKPVTPGQTVTVDIPSGATGFAIGKQLKDLGLITDITAFTSKVEEMQLGPKLRSGKYQIQSGTSLEGIIKVLANVK